MKVRDIVNERTNQWLKVLGRVTFIVLDLSTWNAQHLPSPFFFCHVRLLIFFKQIKPRSISPSPPLENENSLIKFHQPLFPTSGLRSSSSIGFKNFTFAISMNHPFESLVRIRVATRILMDSIVREGPRSSRGFNHRHVSSSKPLLEVFQLRYD